MHLSEFEQKIIKQTAEEIFSKNADVYIFGSRVNAKLRGGDIDIYIETKNGDEDLLEKKIRFLVELEKEIGEQKIDVIINNGLVGDRLIFQKARNNSILL